MEKNNAEVLIDYLNQQKTSITVGQINGIIEVLKVIDVELKNAKGIKDSGPEESNAPSEGGVQGHQESSEEKQDGNKEK